jgi:hypothetical protein
MVDRAVIGCRDFRGHCGVLLELSLTGKATDREAPDSTAGPATKILIYNPFTPSGTLDSRFKVVAVKNALIPGCLSSTSPLSGSSSTARTWYL